VRRCALVSWFAAMVALGAGCSVLEPQADPTRFYVLTPVVETVASPPYLGTVVAIGPVALPSYLDRPQIVTRSASNQVTIQEFERWAEPLPSSFARVLEQNLAASLGVPAVVRYAATGGLSNVLKLEVDVLRFEANAGREAELRARWNLKDAHTRKTLLVRESRHTRPIADHDTAGAVSGLSECIGELSLEISRAILLLPPGQRGG
jgi:uncharacterized lipoprotein YmbA